MKKTLLLGVASTVVIVSSVGVFAALDRTPKEMYFLAEMTQVENMKEQFEKDFSNELKLYKNLNEQSYRSNEKMRLSYDSKDLKSTNPKLHNFLNTLNLDLTTQRDVKNNRLSIKLDLANHEDYIVGIDAFLSSAQIAGKLSGIIEDYIYLNTADYGLFMRKQDPTYKGNDRLEFNPTKVSSHPLDEALTEDVIKQYGKYIYNQIGEENIIHEKVKVDGEKANKLTFTITESEIKLISKNLLTKLKSDADMLDRLSESLFDYYGPANGRDIFFAEEGITKDSIKKEILNTINTSLTALKDDANKPVNVLLTSRITVLKNQIIDRQLTLTNGKGTLMALSHEKSDNGGELKIIRVDSNGKNTTTKEEIFTDSYLFERNRNGFTTDHDFKFGSKNEQPLIIKLNLQRNNQDNDISTKLILTDQDTLTFISNSSYEMTDTTMKGTSDISFDLKETAEITVSSISDTVFTDELNFPELNPKKDVNLAVLNKTRETELIKEIESNFLAIFSEYAELFMPDSLDQSKVNE